MSRSSFAQQFHAAFGVPPVKFLHDVRLRRAAEMFQRSPELAIDQVAGRVGFTSRSHFSREFKKRFGTSPRGLPGRLAYPSDPGLGAPASPVLRLSALGTARTSLPIALTPPQTLRRGPCLRKIRSLSDGTTFEGKLLSESPQGLCKVGFNVVPSAAEGPGAVGGRPDKRSSLFIRRTAPSPGPEEASSGRHWGGIQTLRRPWRHPVIPSLT